MYYRDEDKSMKGPQEWPLLKLTVDEGIWVGGHHALKYLEQTRDLSLSNRTSATIGMSIPAL